MNDRENKNFFVINFDNNHNDLFDSILNLKRNNLKRKIFFSSYQYDWREVEFQLVLNNIHYILVDVDHVLNVNIDTNQLMYLLYIHQLIELLNE